MGSSNSRPRHTRRGWRRRLLDYYAFLVDGRTDGRDGCKSDVEDKTTLIGRGAISFVRLAKRKQDGSIVAIKSTPLTSMSAFDLEGIRKEARILTETTHPNIVKCCDYFEDSSDCHTVMEYLKGGNLLDYLLENETLSEVQARSVVQAVASALQFCHDSCGVVHRDIKPDNILLKDKGISIDRCGTTGNSHNNLKLAVKLSDFAFACEVGDRFTLKLLCGSPMYLAPEIVRGDQYGKPVDMWALGVTLYLMLCGHFPFESDKDWRDLFRTIEKEPLKFKGETWASISIEAKDLLVRMLTKDPYARITAKQVLAHPWLQQAVPNDVSAASTTTANSDGAGRSPAEERLTSRISVSTSSSTSDANKLLITAQGEEGVSYFNDKDFNNCDHHESSATSSNGRRGNDTNDENGSEDDDDYEGESGVWKTCYSVKLSSSPGRGGVRVVVRGGGEDQAVELEEKEDLIIIDDDLPVKKYCDNDDNEDQQQILSLPDIEKRSPGSSTGGTSTSFGIRISQPLFSSSPRFSSWKEFLFVAPSEKSTTSSSVTMSSSTVVTTATATTTDTDGASTTATTRSTNDIEKSKSPTPSSSSSSSYRYYDEKRRPAIAVEKVLAGGPGGNDYGNDDDDDDPALTMDYWHNLVPVPVPVEMVARPEPTTDETSKEEVMISGDHQSDSKLRDERSRLLAILSPRTSSSQKTPLPLRSTIRMLRREHDSVDSFIQYLNQHHHHPPRESEKNENDNQTATTSGPTTTTNHQRKKRFSLGASLFSL